MKRVTNQRKLRVIKEFRIAEDHLIKILDIRYYIKLIGQFNKLKQFVFKNSCLQYSLDYMKKTDLTKEREMENNNKKLEISNLEEMIIWFKMKLESNNMDEADHLLFENLEDAIKSKIMKTDHL